MRSSPPSAQLSDTPYQSLSQSALSSSRPPYKSPTEQNFNFKLGKAIRRRRRLLDLTQNQVATLVGTTYQTINKWESGATRIPLYKFTLLAAALRCKPADLLPEFP